MSKIAFVTDSTAYIPQDLTEKYGITVLPQILIWNEDTYEDGVDITPTEFYKRLAKSDTMPSSSQVPIPKMKEAFEHLLGNGYDEVVGIFISSKLSGTLQSAYQAREMMGSAADKIHIVDSYNTAMGLGFQVLAAARAAEEGASAEECIRTAQKTLQNSGVYFAVDTLEFLHRGGRIGGAQRLFGTMLNLKPVLAILDGRVEPVEKVRTKRKAVSRVLDIVTEKAQGKPNLRLSIIHANAEDEAKKVMAQAVEKLSPVETLLSEVSPVVGTHTGPGVIGVIYAHD